MNNYIVSARKYRPSTFRSVVGQKALVATLRNAVANGKLAHAYLFCGPRGVGKTTCARIFAKTINCLQPLEDGEACNACESCCSFNEQRSFNIHELDAASNNSVDDIRELNEQVRIPPQIGKYKVYIIDEVHMLSTQAFNAFLKTLEEPPHYAIFVLATTEKHKILPTILSRCQIYDFSRISINDTVEHLEYVAKSESIEVETEALNIIAQKSDGGMRDALSIFDQVSSYTGGKITYQATIENLNVLDYDYYFKLTDAILLGNVPEALLIFNEILNKGFEGNSFVTGLSSHLRDLLVCKDEQTIVLFEVGASIRERYLQTARKCPILFLYKAIELANDCDINYRLSRNKKLLVELLLIRLCQILNPAHNATVPDKTIAPVSNQPSPTNSPAPAVKESVAPASIQVASQTLAAQGKPEESNAEQKKLTKTDTQSAPMSKAHAAIIEAEQRARENFNKYHRRPISISLNDPQKPEIKPEEKKPENKTSTQIEDKPFSTQELEKEWNNYAQQLTNQPHLRNSMINCKPVIVNDSNFFEITVHNKMQQEAMEKEMPLILAHLKKGLQNSKVAMSIHIAEASEKKPVYATDAEKFKLMSEKKGALLKLKDEFGLMLE